MDLLKQPVSSPILGNGNEGTAATPRYAMVSRKFPASMMGP
jgi:hypothetical protein